MIIWHWRAELLPCYVPCWRLTHSDNIFIGILVHGCVSERAVLSFCELTARTLHQYKAPLGGYICNWPYYYHQIKSLLSSFPIVVCLKWQYQLMLSVSYIFRESWGLFSLLLWSLMDMCTNNRDHYSLMVIFVCVHITLSHYHHHAECI